MRELISTANPIEQAFATARPRTKVTEGTGSRTAAFTMNEPPTGTYRSTPTRLDPKVLTIPRAGGRTAQGALQFSSNLVSSAIALTGQYDEGPGQS
ncbi:hypothetical protein ACFV0Y_20395 [Streptomyces sp. NPDC059569]|uniref:hypothetical protein n=1 Tax=Streptomyces sp. NPDC059569 TaxID=3346869 RepID=UPI0036C62001